MSWWGKIIGGAFGFVIGGPIGALIFGALGHSMDKGIKMLDMDAESGNQWDKERTQTAFFAATFSIMGHLAKADGQVTKEEIQMARSIMDHMELTEDQRKLAIDLFNKGKEDNFPLNDILEQFRRECFRRRNLIQMFIEMQLHAVYADGVVHKKERAVLQYICAKLGFGGQEFDRLEDMVKAQYGFANGRARHAQPSQGSISDAYKMLGVASTATDAEVKKAYRRLMSQHHPDKLVSKGLPEEMMKMATEKTQEIKAAYELIKEEEGGRVE